MHLIFVLFVLAGFLFMLLAQFPVPQAARIAWGCWLIAALLWALTAAGVPAG
jgi:hypothetical protein